MTEPGTVELRPGAGAADARNDPATTAADVRLAWLHLRLGMVAEARAELEDLARRERLDRDDQAALAEARWRTGDLDSAAAAARAHLDAGGADPVAVVIAAEGAAATGEIATFRELVERVRRLDATALDAIFAGMPRRGSWPVIAAPAGGPAAAGGTAGPGDGRVEGPAAGVPAAWGAAAAAAAASAPAAAGRAAAGPAAAGRAAAGPAAATGPADGSVSPGPTRSVPGPAEVLAATPELWDTATPGASVSAVRPPAGPGGDAAASTAIGPARESGPSLPIGPAAAPGATAGAPHAPHAPAGRARPWGHADPDAELERAREEIGDAPERGLLRLALVLRLDPTLAPDVLDAVRLRRGPAAAIIRGDAERLIGRHLEAEAAFADAAEAIERARPGSSPAAPPPRPPAHQEDS